MNREEAENQKKSLNWFWSLLRMSKSKFNERSFNPVNDPFIGRTFYVYLRPKAQGYSSLLRHISSCDAIQSL